MDVNATFDQIAQLINDKNYTDLGSVPELQHLASEGNIIFTVIDKLGNRFTAEVYQNPETDDLQPPLLQQIPYLTNLPPPILVGVVIRMSLPDVMRMCRTNRYLNANICNSEEFWKRKFIRDFGSEDTVEGERKAMTTPNYWKQRYQNFGNVYSFGNNVNGQLGLGDQGPGTNRDNPTLITSIPPIKAISAGVSHSLIFNGNGDVWSFGNGYSGQLGLGDLTNRDKPTLITGIPPIPPIKRISAGEDYSLLLDVNGGVWSFGYNRFGQLGLGDHGHRTERDTPTLITGTPPLPPIKDISAGLDHSLVLDINGGVWSFGNNSYGQLGLGDHGEGTDRNRPTLITDIPPIKVISNGNYRSLLLDNNGGVWVFGLNDYGRLGLGDRRNRDRPTLITGIPLIKAISSGVGHSLVLDTNGGVWSFGYNRYGQLGLGDHGEGTDRDKPTLITGIPLIGAIFSGGINSLILDFNGGVWSFGHNRFGQLGLGDYGVETSRHKPTLITGIPPIGAISTRGGHSLLISY